MSLQQVVKHLKDGDDVIIHSGNRGRCFITNNNVKGEDKLTIYCDVSSWERLLDDGEWEDYIKIAGFKEVDFDKLTIINIAKYKLCI